MIKKSLLTASCLLVAYCIFWITYSPKYKAPQDLWQDSQMRVQEYVLSDSHFENVIIGSSLAYMINTDSLHNCFNLGLRGSQPLSSLKIIIQERKYPNRVFIETNTLFLDLTKGNIFDDVYYNPIMLHLRRLNPAFRDGNQPLLTVSNSIQSSLFDPKDAPEYLYDASHFFSQSINIEDPEQVLSRVMAYTTEPPLDVQERNMKELKIYIDSLKQHNTKIIFFEMPVCEILRTQPMAVSTRRIVKEYFPPEEYTYILEPEKDYPYKTYDSMHLDLEEAAIFTHYFKNHVDSLIAIGK